MPTLYLEYSWANQAKFKNFRVVTEFSFAHYCPHLWTMLGTLSKRTKAELPVECQSRALNAIEPIGGNSLSHSLIDRCLATHRHILPEFVSKRKRIRNDYRQIMAAAGIQKGL